MARTWKALRISLRSIWAICSPRLGTVTMSRAASSRGIISRTAPSGTSSSRTSSRCETNCPARRRPSRSLLAEPPRRRGFAATATTSMASSEAGAAVARRFSYCGCGGAWHMLELRPACRPNPGKPTVAICHVTNNIVTTDCTHCTLLVRTSPHHHPSPGAPFHGTTSSASSRPSSRLSPPTATWMSRPSAASSASC